MNYVNVKVLPTPYNIEFKQLGKLIFDINYVDCGVFGPKRWCNSKGRLHREDGPATIWKNGEQYWYRYGKLHREDGPAMIWNDGDQCWHLNNIYYSKKEFNEEIRRRNELRECKNLTETL